MNANATARFIDVSEVIKKKNPRLHKILPRFIIKLIARIIHQDELNDDLKILSDLSGIPKFREFLKIKNIQVEIIGGENIPKEGRFIFASNHPLGGPDGVLFVAAVSNYFNAIKFIVNDILLFLPGVKDVFLPTNKHGGNSREYLHLIDEAYDSQNQMLIFPSGLVSRKKNGKIADLPWKKSFVSAAKKYKRDVIPVFIDGKNSNFFYNLANFRMRFGIKANIEMFFLVDEFYRHKNETIKIYFGEPISYEIFDDKKSINEWAEQLKKMTYALPLLGK